MTSSNLYPQLEKRELLNSLEDVVKHFVASMLHFCNPSSREEVDANSRRRFHLLPPPSTARMPITALRIAYLASIAHGGIASRTLICKRDVYYMCSALFPKQTLVDSALSALGLVLNVDRNDLNIIAAAKGIVAGRVCFVEESGCRVDVGMFGSHGCLIPARPERMTHVEISASATLVYVFIVLFLSTNERIMASSSFFFLTVMMLCEYVVYINTSKGLKRKLCFNRFCQIRLPKNISSLSSL